MALRSIGLILVVHLLSSCASFYDRDKNSKEYYEGRGFVALPEKDSAHWGGRPSGDRGMDATSALVIGAAAVAANPDYYKKSGVQGTCLLSVNESQLFDTPCRNVTIVLKDTQGNPIGRMGVVRGRFGFLARAGKSYQLDIDSEKYRLKAEQSPKVQMGDDVTLRIVEKKPR